MVIDSAMLLQADCARRPVQSIPKGTDDTTPVQSTRGTNRRVAFAEGNTTPVYAVDEMQPPSHSPSQMSNSAIVQAITPLIGELKAVTLDRFDAIEKRITEVEKNGQAETNILRQSLTTRDDAFSRHVAPPNASQSSTQAAQVSAAPRFDFKKKSEPVKREDVVISALPAGWEAFARKMGLHTSITSRCIGLPLHIDRAQRARSRRAAPRELLLQPKRASRQNL
jgi:hypothetical protein